MAPEHCRHRGDHRPDVALRNDNLVREDTRGFLGNCPAGATDERRHHHCRERIEQRITQPDAKQRAEDRARRQHIAAGVPGVRSKHFALEAPRLAFLVGHDEQVDDQCDRHDADPFREDPGCAAVHQSVVGGAQHLHEHENQEHQDAERGERLVLAMAVGVVGVRWPACDGHTHERDHVGGGVGQRVEAVGED